MWRGDGDEKDKGGSRVMSAIGSSHIKQFKNNRNASTPRKRKMVEEKHHGTENVQAPTNTRQA